MLEDGGKEFCGVRKEFIEQTVLISHAYSVCWQGLDTIVAAESKGVFNLSRKPSYFFKNRGMQSGIT